MRLSLVLLLALTACGPALTMKRLAPPKKALGTARTVRVEVVPASVDALPGEAVRVSDEVKRLMSERVAAVGYGVCTEADCGEGVLQVTLARVAVGDLGDMPHRPSFSMMDDAMRIVRGGLEKKIQTEIRIAATTMVPVLLEGTITMVQADGKTAVEERFSYRHSKVAPPAEVVRETAGQLASNFSAGLSRQAPLREVPLEGGGELNRGVELLHKADWAAAVTYFTELTRLHPELHGGWYDLGFALEAQNKWREALDAYETAVRLEPKPHYEYAAMTMRRLVPLIPK